MLKAPWVLFIMASRLRCPGATCLVRPSSSIRMGIFRFVCGLGAVFTNVYPNGGMGYYNWVEGLFCGRTEELRGASSVAGRGISILDILIVTGGL